jgi:hypothetical protein
VLIEIKEHRRDPSDALAGLNRADKLAFGLAEVILGGTDRPGRP